MAARKVALIVEDDAGMVDLMQFGLRLGGYDVVHARNSAEFSKLIHLKTFDVIICDVNLGEARTGVDLFLETVKTGRHKGPFVLMTGDALNSNFEFHGLDPSLPKPLILFKPFSIGRMTDHLALRMVADSDAVSRPTTVSPPISTQTGISVRHDLKNKLMTATENVRISGLLLARTSFGASQEMGVVNERLAKSLAALDEAFAIIDAWGAKK